MLQYFTVSLIDNNTSLPKNFQVTISTKLLSMYTELSSYHAALLGGCIKECSPSVYLSVRPSVCLSVPYLRFTIPITPIPEFDCGTVKMHNEI